MVRLASQKIHQRQLNTLKKRCKSRQRYLLRLLPQQNVDLTHPHTYLCHNKRGKHIHKQNYQKHNYCTNAPSCMHRHICRKVPQQHLENIQE